MPLCACVRACVCSYVLIYIYIFIYILLFLGGGGRSPHRSPLDPPMETDDQKHYALQCYRERKNLLLGLERARKLRKWSYKGRDVAGAASVSI